MRRAVRAWVWVAAGVTLAGCGELGAGTRPEADRARMKAVAVAWDGSAAARAWREGFHPLDDPVRLPPDAWHGSEDKLAFDEKRLVWEAGPTDGAVRNGTVRWKDGRRLEVRLTHPGSALELLPGADAPAGTGAPGAQPLRIKAFRLGTREVRTSTGPATVPVWSFTLVGYEEPLTKVAVERSSPPSGPIGSVDPNMSGNGLELVSAEGRTLTVRAGHGSCDRGAKVDVLETAETVVLAGSVILSSDPGADCDSALRMQTLTVKLSRPLGLRVPLDAYSGEPLTIAPFYGRPS
ncbi:hypothetical protein [Streptomyces sp. NPDC097619]|uniref:hypothetical protein n=1 Tax=Streptomyces sp. NPDC097619 TaxID=3157228 RepID=UPI003329B6B8